MRPCPSANLKLTPSEADIRESCTSYGVWRPRSRLGHLPAQRNLPPSCKTNHSSKIFASLGPPPLLCPVEAAKSSIDCDLNHISAIISTFAPRLRCVVQCSARPDTLGCWPIFVD